MQKPEVTFYIADLNVVEDRVLIVRVEQRSGRCSAQSAR